MKILLQVMHHLSQILKDQQSDLFSRKIHRLIRFKAPSDADLQAKLKDMKKVPVLHLRTNMLTLTDALMIPVAVFIFF